MSVSSHQPDRYRGRRTRYAPDSAVDIISIQTIMVMIVRHDLKMK